MAENHSNIGSDRLTLGIETRSFFSPRGKNPLGRLAVRYV